VLGVDTSQRAVSLAWANAERNGLGNVRFQCGDAFETLESLIRAGERFGAVILDPPKFARSRGALDEALRAYHWLNRLGVSLLEPDGYLVTCSCSGHVLREDFLDMLRGVAQQTGRDIQVLEQRGAAPDHPINVSCPESEYLKCFICRVV
jgi:23S rRNA (cytosine1962-C5)-methyltransferase